MSETLDHNTLHIYGDKINVSFNPKSLDDDEPKKHEKEKENKDEFRIGKSKIIAIVLALFLGRYGIHKFYLGRPSMGLVYLIFSRFQFIRFLSFCDVFIYIFMKRETWLKEYGYQTRPKIKKKDNKKK